jgi:hypothetical protein
MAELPHTEVVDFLGVEAYSYSHVRLARYDRLLDLYVIPSVTAAPTAIACYASQGASSDLRGCEQIVATLTPVRSSGYDLRPSASYSSMLGPVIGALDGERLIIRRQMGAVTAPRTVGLATTLADRFATAAAATRVLRPPAAAAAAQAALVASLERASESYRALAGAAAGTAAAAAEARANVAGAEAGVDGALATFALLGYKHA